MVGVAATLRVPPPVLVLELQAPLRLQVLEADQAAWHRATLLVRVSVGLGLGSQGQGSGQGYLGSRFVGVRVMSGLHHG